MTTRLANLRDLGGLPLASGGRTLPGVLLRSDAPYAGDLDPAGLPDGVAWPPAAVIDLRAERERARSPYPWPTSTVTVAHELHDAGDLGRMPELGLIAVYESILETAAERVTAVPGLLAADGPTLIHCAAGKDRTGIVVAVLLLLAGVEPEAVVADYLVTAAQMDGVIARLTAAGGLKPERAREEWFAAPEEAGRLVVETVTAHPGGVEGWYVEHGGDLAALERFRGRFVGH